MPLTSARPGMSLPWLDQPADVPPPAQSAVGNLLEWEALELVSDAERQLLHRQALRAAGDRRAASDRLSIDGLVDHPMSVSLADLKHRARRAVDFTLECSGNTGLPFFIGGIGNARWGGARWHRCCEQAGISKRRREVVFWGDGQRHRHDPRRLRHHRARARPARSDPTLAAALDLTITEQFARSMSVADAMTRGTSSATT